MYHLTRLVLLLMCWLLLKEKEVVIISDYCRGSQCIFSLMVVAVHDTLGHDVVLSYIVLCMGGSKKQSVLTVARMLLYEKLLSSVVLPDCCFSFIFGWEKGSGEQPACTIVVQ